MASNDLKEGWKEVMVKKRGEKMQIVNKFLHYLWNLRFHKRTDINVNGTPWAKATKNVKKPQNKMVES